jgi:LuxR family transcriptional regulator, maltose regulon positive regulatory protein
MRGAVTASPVVETKLYIPNPPRGLVARPRLRERLSRGTQSRLTLLSAPAGFGKTTLLAGWLAFAAPAGRPVAWLSLEESDSQPASFWTYVINALQTVVPGVGTSALPLLQSAQPPIEAVLATLLNGLAAAPNDIDLVLDDYHLVDGPEVRVGMAFLLAHLPPHVHLVISTRADPALPLARLRARGELVEIRAADLRFTRDEVAAYLNEVGGLHLGANDIRTLEGRTEGWIAALQLAALSMQGRDDIPGFVERFAGDDRYIVDYLVEEVLQRQPDDVRSFLLRTCLLDRLSGPLCDAVTGQHGGRAMLEALDRANLFVIPLDDRRHWYRYHHLFADVLRTHLADERPKEVQQLHLRASEWYEHNGVPSSAVRHALAAQDVDRAAHLVELAIPTLLRNRQEATIRSWLEEIPDGIVEVRPVLGIGFVAALMAGGELEGVEDRLEAVERCLEPATPTGEGRRAPGPTMLVVDEAELPRLPAEIELYRAGLALAHADLAGTVRHAARAIEVAPDDDHVDRAGASALLGLAFWTSGDLEAGHRAYSACVDGLRRAGHIADVLGCSIALADMRITQGRLSEALRTYEQGLQLASSGSAAVLRGTADMYVGMSQIACERGDVDGATQHLLRSQELGEPAGLPQNPYRWRVAMARVRQAEGDPSGAVDLLTEAQRVYIGDYLPNVRPVPALRARVLAVQGRWREGCDWARTEGLSTEDDLSYLREFEHITLARVLLARSTGERADSVLHEATALLERLLEFAEAGQRTASVIEILVLQALARHAQGGVRASVAPLERALSLAEPEGFVRVFADEGAAMASLLTTVANRGVARDYVRRLLEACGGGRDDTMLTRRATSAPRNLVEPLSDRELDVLRLLASDLNGPDIARQLTLSLNTVRTHTRNIYAKLGVNNRRSAVRQAMELNVLSGARER